MAIRKFIALEKERRAVGLLVDPGLAGVSSWDLEKQERFLENYAQFYGLRLERVFRVQMGQGKSPVVDRVLEALEGEEEGVITDLVCTKMESLSCSPGELLDLFERLQEKGVDLHFAQDDIHTMADGGYLFRNILSAMAEARPRVQDRPTGYTPLRRTGKKLVRKFTLGYDYDSATESLVANEDAPVVKLVFEKFLEMRCCEKVANYLNQQGVDTGTTFPRKWDRDYVELILNNDAYVGNYTYHNYKVGRHHEPIIDVKLFDEVQRMR